jgi:hypothetical protein
MKHAWIKGKRGMTLLEVIMACVLLPVIIFGATSLLMAMARVSDKTNAGMDFLMKADTVFLRLEEDLLNVTATPPYPQIVWGAGNIELQTSATAGFRYTFATRALINKTTGASFSTGVLLPDAPLDDFNKNGAIDAGDAGLRDACLAALTQAACHTVGVPLVFGVATDQNRLDFSFRSERHQENGQHGLTKSIPLAK